MFSSRYGQFVAFQDGPRRIGYRSRCLAVTDSFSWGYRRFPAGSPLSLEWVRYGHRSPQRHRNRTTVIVVATGIEPVLPAPSYQGRRAAYCNYATILTSVLDPTEAGRSTLFTITELSKNDRVCNPAVESGRQDLNLRPRGPEPRDLPN